MSDKLTMSLMAADAETIATLRRELEEAREKLDLWDEWKLTVETNADGNVRRLGHQLAAVTLDNARLRKLADRAVYAYLDDEKASYKVVDSAMTDLRAALASSPDAMVERARKYMSHDKYCDKMFGRPTGCTCGLDALLAEIGGKP